LWQRCCCRRRRRAAKRGAVGSEGYNDAASSGDGANCSNDEMAVIFDVIMIA